MSEPVVLFQFDEHEGLYWPGDTIAGEYRVQSCHPQEIKAIECSVLWHTLGKGEEDLAVHFFQRETCEGGDSADVGTPRRFQTLLPNSPLSYDGLIVKICWCIRVRVFLRSGREVVAEQPFQLGATPRPQLVQP